MNLLPILVAGGVLAALPAPSQDAGRYAREIATWAEQDRDCPPPPGGLLVVGSSSIRRFEGLAELFADHDVVQRGFGGSTFPDVLGSFESLVAAPRPAGIVVFEGSNDVAAGRSADQVFADWQRFVALTRESLGDVPVCFIGITPTPSRWARWPVAAEINRRIREHAEGQEHLHYIDVPTPFLATGGPPDDSLFVADRLHLSPAGYRLFGEAIRAVVEVVVPVRSPDPGARRTLRSGEALLLDLGPSNAEDGAPTGGGGTSGEHWNDWYPVRGGSRILAGERLPRLVTTAGAATDVTVLISGGFRCNGLRHGGLRDPDPTELGSLGVASATADYFYSDDQDDPGGLVIQGLDPALTYDARCFASRAAPDARVTRYRWRGADETVVELQVSGAGVGADGSGNGNDTRVAKAEGLRSDAHGQLFLDVQRATGDYAYLAALELRAR